MPISRLPLAICAFIIAWSFGCPAAYAADLKGAWASDASACNKMFTNKDGKIAIVKDSDLYGSGFIVEQNRVRGKIATCNIIARKEDGAVIHLVANCSTDIAIETVQLSFKIEDQNRITRFYPGVPELAVQYFRCPL